MRHPPRGYTSHLQAVLSQPFFKGYTGIGLGLPLAKAIIEAHGGLIEVESELGIGTSFIMNFPIPTKL